MKIHDYVTQKDQFLLTSLLFCPNHFELCDFVRIRRKQHILSTDYNFLKSQITVSKILSSSDLLKNHKDVIGKSFGYMTGLYNDSFNEINVLKQE